MLKVAKKKKSAQSLELHKWKICQVSLMCCHIHVNAKKYFIDAHFY